jgi:hypothetical protein
MNAAYDGKGNSSSIIANDLTRPEHGTFRAGLLYE